jgi:hypothetical protein
MNNNSGRQTRKEIYESTDIHYPKQWDEVFYSADKAVLKEEIEKLFWKYPKITLVKGINNKEDYIAIKFIEELLFLSKSEEEE